jgi:serine/threonine protein kinase
LGEELANTFVLKTYFGRDVESYYKSEIETFWQLHSHKNIIGFQGCFTRGDSYNVLLEYADKGTLEDYLRNEVPPTSGEEIIQFWESLFGVLEALMYIQDKASFYMPDKFQG